MGLRFDEEAARRVEAIYSTPDVVAQRQAVLHTLELRPGESVLDVGSGPGFLAAEMALAVGASGRVCGVDISESMVTMSQRRCARLSHAEFHVGNATQLPFSDADFDVAVSTQVYEYLTEGDLTTALAEIHRVLRPGGRVLILEVIPLFNPAHDPNTYSYGLIDMITTFAPGRRGVTREEVKEWAEDLKRQAEEGSYFFSLNRYLFFATKPT